MAKKKKDDLKDLTVTELTGRLRKGEVEFFEKKIQHRTGQLKDTASLWKARKEMARIKTYLTQKSGV